MINDSLKTAKIHSELPFSEIQFINKIKYKRRNM